MFAEDISEDFSDLTFTGFYRISGYLRNLRGRSLSSEKFSEVFTLWVFTLKPFPENLFRGFEGLMEPFWGGRRFQGTVLKFPLPKGASRTENTTESKFTTETQLTTPIAKRDGEVSAVPVFQRKSAANRYR